MNPPPRPGRRASTSVPAAGFSLVEVTLALGIGTFGLIAIFGLLPVGLNSQRAAAEETAAVNMMTSLVTDLRVTARTAGAASPTLGIALPAAPTASYPAIDGSATATLFLDESGGPSPAPTTVSPTSRYRVLVSFAVPAAGQRTATLARVAVSWPAQALPANASGSVTTLVALDRN